MKKIIVNMLTGLCALNFALLAAVAHSSSDAAKNEYKAAVKSANAIYRADRAKCDVLSGNPKDVCIEEAKAEEKRSKADAKARYENTPKARMKARLDKADANYSVAREKCSAYSGNEKNVCIKEAKAAQTKAKTAAKSDREINEIKSDAAQDKADADYKVAVEKCNSLAGPSKDACIAAAKSRYSK